MVGNRLCAMLREKGHTVRNLSRTGSAPAGAQGFAFDWKRRKLDKRALLGADVLIHLAGAGIADEPWTDERKLEIIASRTQTLDFIAEVWRNEGLLWPSTVLSASGMGYYGVQTTDVPQKENNPPGVHFLSEVCQKWEGALDAFSREGIRTAALRISLVLSGKGGALPVMAKPVKYFVGAPLGSGKQWMSWIHVDDLCRMFILLMENEQLTGAFNAATPVALRHSDFMRRVAEVLHRPLWPVNVPTSVMRIILGERADLVLKGVPLDVQKILDTGFAFEYTELTKALHNCFHKS
jgi:uncharacterized protein (TIGR01777 family)